MKFLKLFYEVNLRISASNTCTSSLYYEELEKIRMHWTKFVMIGDSLLDDMTKRMQTKYDKYQDDLKKVNRLLLMAVVLGPQFKMIWLDF